MIDMAELANYGVLGIWTVFNLSTIFYYRKKDDEQDKNLRKVIENNTIAMTRVLETMHLCSRR